MEVRFLLFRWIKIPPISLFLGWVSPEMWVAWSGNSGLLQTSSWLNSPRGYSCCFVCCGCTDATERTFWGVGICGIYSCQSLAFSLYPEPAFYEFVLVPKDALKYSALFLTHPLWRGIKVLGMDLSNREYSRHMKTSRKLSCYLLQ